MCLITKQWQSIETAPKDGSAILLNVGYPWPVVGAWNAYHEEWVSASQQIGMVNGQWIDTYFENEYEKTPKSWMPLPQLTEGE